jgi:hypothetical protein
MLTPDNIIKEISFIGTEYEYYSHPILTANEEDSLLLDTAQTTSMIFHDKSEYNGVLWGDGRDMIMYPKFHRGEKYKLPINKYSILEYNNVSVKFYHSTLENSLGGEGNKIEILSKIENKDEYHLDKVYSLLNFEGKSWQHFVQDALPILIFGLDFLQENPDIDILIYEPHTWSKETFFELMSYFNIQNKIIFLPHQYEFILNVKTLYKFDSSSTIPVWWFNNWFYEKINKLLNIKDSECKNVILIERPNSRSIQNIDEISFILNEYASNNGLNYLRFNPSDLKPDELFKIFQNAHTIVSPHGGANYNLIFCNSNVKFIELCFIDCMYTLYNLASSIKCKYYIIPNRGHNNTQNLYLSPEKLKKIIYE